jgi:Sec-independent protein secretion pathway component TatC
MFLQPEPLAFVGFGLAAVAAVAGGVALAYAVFADATARESDHARFWAVVCAVSPFVLVYLLVRRRLGPRGPPTDRERLARTAAGAVAAAFVAGAVFAPPDPLTQVRWFWPSLLLTLPVSYYAFYRA